MEKVKVIMEAEYDDRMFVQLTKEQIDFFDWLCDNFCGTCVDEIDFQIVDNIEFENV